MIRNIYVSTFFQIFNLRRRTEHGALTHADGTINAMKFYDRRHLFTGAEDGRVSILKTGTWRVEKTLMKHQVLPRSKSKDKKFVLKRLNSLTIPYFNVDHYRQYILY